ncbi:hypothetical protein QTH87_05880 [Variovorax sp. J22P168]|uniref:hypothetical protein n=1 Tax=Variovorax jilinensis TaxID=3053513 RepID=UPI0025777112|nr:hypothetical protein [Variovorax sp. J22P168]MDM0011967.1 hypothetical protein [Variovorax sp. J22P168]
MPTITSGLFFVAKDRPGRAAIAAACDASGTFIATMRVFDNQGPRRLESYVVRWTGADARAWWDAHGPLKAGDALALELLNPRSFPGFNAPEIHADVSRCRLMPRHTPSATAAAA